MDILRVLATPDSEVRKKTLSLVLDLVSTRNIEDIVQVLKKVCTFLACFFPNIIIYSKFFSNDRKLLKRTTLLSMKILGNTVSCWFVLSIPVALNSPTFPLRSYQF